MTSENDKDNKINIINDQQASPSQSFIGRYSKLIWFIVALVVVYFIVSGVEENDASKGSDFQYSSAAKADILKLISSTAFSCAHITSASNRVLSEKIDVQCSNGARFDVYKNGGRWVVEATD